jgi:nucleotide-binding universal stress UspA family protein
MDERPTIIVGVDGSEDGGGMVQISSSPVVVGVDASASARDAAEWAADLAATWDAPLHLVHTVHGWPDDATLPERPRWLRELVGAAECCGVRTVVAEVVRGGIVDTLLDRAAGARMLVVGSYGEGAWSGMLAGSVAITVIDRSACSVAVIRGRVPQVPPPRTGPIVVGVDGSEAGGVALDLAAELAESFGCRLLAVRATVEAVVEAVEAQLASVRLRHPALAVQEQVGDSTALATLGEQAHGARLLVIGRHRVGPGVDITLGATVRGLVESAPCPVLVAAHPQRGLPEPAVGSERAAR